jgi:hypothetical protein
MAKSVDEIHERIRKLTMLASDTSTTEAERETARRKLTQALDELRATAEPPTVGIGERLRSALGVNVESIMQNIGANVAPILIERTTRTIELQATNLINAGFDRYEDFIMPKTTTTKTKTTAAKPPPKRNGAKPPPTPKPKPVERMTRAALIDAIETGYMDVDIADANGEDVESVLITLLLPVDVLDMLISDRPDAAKITQALGSLVLDAMAEGPHGDDLFAGDDDDEDGEDDEGESDDDDAA